MRILIVDDESLIRMDLRDILESEHMKWLGKHRMVLKLLRCVKN